MKKFGRQGQYYKDSKSMENINKLNNDFLYENQSWGNDIDYEDPVDLEFLNQFQNTSNSNLNSATKSNFKGSKDKEIYNTPKFNTEKKSQNKNNDSSSYVRYIRLSELNDNNPYNSLDISQLATDEEIRKAYKRLIVINHPDKGGDPYEFNKIHEAYQMLSNPLTKKIIDTFGSRSLDLVKNIIINNDLISNKQLIDDVNFCIQQNDYPQLYFLLNNIKN